MLKFDEDMTRVFFADQLGRGSFDALLELMISDPSVAIEFIGENTIQAINMIAGPLDPKIAK